MQTKMSDEIAFKSLFYCVLDFITFSFMALLTFVTTHPTLMSWLTALRLFFLF